MAYGTSAPPALLIAGVLSGFGATEAHAQIKQDSVEGQNITAAVDL
jgi:hypothetical protein